MSDRALRLRSDPIPGGGANVRGHFEQRNSIANFEGGGIALGVLHSGAQLMQPAGTKSVTGVSGISPVQVSRCS